MLRRKLLKKIYFTTLVVFVLFVISSFTINKNIPNIKVEYQNNLKTIYLLDDNNYLLAVNITVSDNLKDSIPIVINNLKENSKHYSGLKGVIPSNTEVNSIDIKDGIITIDFNNNLLNVNENLEEKVIESIVYSLLGFDDVKGVIITVNGKKLDYLPKSKIKLDDVLTKKFGINKEYNITSMNDIERVVLYYYEEKDNVNYYVPVTKYVNSSDDKIKIIIDNLKNSYLSKTNLMSYLNEKIKIDNYEKEGDMVTLNFSNIIDFANEEIEEEVIYAIANSIFDSTDAMKVIFLSNDNIISVKTK